MQHKYFKCHQPGCEFRIRLDGRAANRARNAHIKSHKTTFPPQCEKLAPGPQLAGWTDPENPDRLS